MPERQQPRKAIHSQPPEIRHVPEGQGLGLAVKTPTRRPSSYDQKLASTSLAEDAVREFWEQEAERRRQRATGTITRLTTPISSEDLREIRRERPGSVNQDPNEKEQTAVSSRDNPLNDEQRRKLEQIDQLVAQGSSVNKAIATVRISKFSYYSWRKKRENE